MSTTSETEVDVSGTSYRYNCNCNRLASTKNTAEKHRFPINGACKKVARMLSNSITRQKSSTAQNTATEICDGSSPGKPNKKIRSDSTSLRQYVRRFVVSYNITDPIGTLFNWSKVHLYNWSITLRITFLFGCFLWCPSIFWGALSSKIMLVISYHQRFSMYLHSLLFQTETVFFVVCTFSYSACKRFNS